jgi:membrane-bound metal-dependent hydrolase YbcI (DUF457 family)
MHRRGHVGIALLAYAPVGFVLLRERQFGLALLGLIGVLLVEPLPDSDFWLPGLSHRGVSHSILSMLVVGGVLGALGWFIGDRVTVLLAGVLTGLDTTTVGIFAGLFQWTAEQLGALDGRTLAVFGFTIGAFGVFVHLLADALTIAGIRPLLPLSRWRLSLSSLRADSTVANNVLLGLGVLVLASVFLATAPGVGLFGAPAALSPVDVAAGQSANATNTTNATVAFANQTTNGSNVTIESATLPEGGFIAIHSSGYTTGGASATSSAIATSEHLEAGEHTNVTVEVSNAPPGNYPGLNRSQLNESGPLTAMVHRDTNGNERMDYVRSLGANDTAYSGSEGRPVADSAGITVPTTKEPAASVTFRNQTLQNGTLVVEEAHLPDGGFLVIQNESYQRTSDALTSSVGLSSYLPPGNHTNVTIELLPGALDHAQTVTVRPSRDTNSNQRYDYIRSDGFRDVAYTAANGSGVVTDSATVRVPGSNRPTRTQTPGSTPTKTAASTESSTMTAAQGGTGGSSGLFDGLGPLLLLALLAVVAGVILAGRGD